MSFLTEFICTCFVKVVYSYQQSTDVVYSGVYSEANNHQRLAYVQRLAIVSWFMSKAQNLVNPQIGVIFKKQTDERLIRETI
jgi:hypothetical protein